MAHLTADAMTSKPAMQVHAGVNAQVCQFAMGSTSSASLTVALCALPAGSRVLSVWHAMSNGGFGTGGELVSVYANIGGQTTPVSAQYQFILSAIAVGQLVASSTVGTANTGRDLGKRITASANLFCRYTNQVGTGTGTVDVTVVVQYLCQERGD